MNQRTATVLLTSLGLSAALIAAGCTGSNGFDAVSVLRHDQCEGLQAGIAQVDFAALAGIRGSTLLGMTGAEPQGDDKLLLIAISRGSRPTAGYGLELTGAHREADTAVIEVHWQTPDPGAMLAQIVTHPCLVVGLSGQGLSGVEARDQHGTQIGRLELPLSG